MKIKNIGDGLEKKPTALIEGQRSPNSADLESSPEKPKSDVGSSNGTAIKNNSKNSIEAKPNSKWEIFQDELIIALCVSMTILFVPLLKYILDTFNTHIMESLPDSEKDYILYSFRTDIISMLHYIVIGYALGIGISYGGYICYSVVEKGCHYLLWLVFVGIFIIIYGLVLLLALCGCNDAFSLWLLSLLAVSGVSCLLIYGKRQLSRLLPPSYAEFTKIVPWEAIYMTNIILFLYVVSYSDLVYEYGDVKLNCVNYEQDNNLSKMNCM
ncbi:hypothetical protein NECID01_1804 [Nematocida sp. AWRm77]|nr:hypothetical protein NECID01_1804 [Nematocida sp. AWRm77]